MHRVAWRGYERGGGLVVHFKWIALSLVVPSPKHYNASASDLHLSGAPNTGARQGKLVVVLSTKTECVPRTAQRSDNCRLNVQLTLIETIVSARVCGCGQFSSNPALALS